jgi:hypothetical protein
MSSPDLHDATMLEASDPSRRQEVALSRLFRRSKPLYIASDALRERIMKIIGGHLQSSADLPD